MDKNELANLLESFVAGTSEKWDWDDFISVPQRDSEIEKIRKRLLSLDKEYPPNREGQYCNDEGEKILLGIAASLKISSN